MESSEVFFKINSKDVPRWWKSDKAGVEKYYKSTKQYPNGGVETRKLIYDKKSATAYIIESYENWSGA